MRKESQGCLGWNSLTLNISCRVRVTKNKIIAYVSYQYCAYEMKYPILTTHKITKLRSIKSSNLNLFLYRTSSGYELNVCKTFS